jgi:hypothetical protein
MDSSPQEPASKSRQCAGRPSEWVVSLAATLLAHARAKDDARPRGMFERLKCWFESYGVVVLYLGFAVGAWTAFGVVTWLTEDMNKWLQNVALITSMAVYFSVARLVWWLLNRSAGRG